jgi:hypothetical protein
MNDAERQASMIRTMRTVGAILQAILLGEALFFALWTLYSVQTGSRVFRYAGF